MKTWTDTTFQLDSNAFLTVCEHSETSGTVSLNHPGYSSDGHGFSIHFSTAHIEIIEKLLQELRDIKALEKRAEITLLEDDLAA